ncbi:hypothetical protein [Rhizomonospora bruguierae]|uniref:hypothetical protein n=1 Tax=Rhizomonospora bruguierae TaxID=1581705 RepID=UPI001BCDDB3E|nr:hypothetical protein [Micromonospora sp. NBRC 107566]
MTPLPPHAPRSIRDLRPRRLWYLVAALIAVLGATAGVALFALALSGAIRDVKLPDQVFRPGEPVTTQVSAATDKIIWIDARTPSARAACDVSALDGGEARLENVGMDMSYSAGEANWRGLYRLNALRDGRYQVICQGDTARLALGDPPRIGGLAGKLGFGLGALFGLPCLGLVAGGVLGLVVAMRRRARRRELPV